MTTHSGLMKQRGKTRNKNFREIFRGQYGGHALKDRGQGNIVGDNISGGLLLVATLISCDE